jgi:asparagine synthase (glutamine-hydrolysing)
MTGMTKVDIEKLFYYSTFQKYFPNLESVLPYYWMPKYSNTNDPSARTLEIYEKQENQENQEKE